VPLEAQSQRKALVVCLQLSPSQGSMTDALRQMLRGLQASLTSHLPSYAVPSIYLPMVALPQLPSGKADRRKLADIASRLSADDIRQSSLAAEKKEAPVTEMEQTIQTLWADALHLDRASIGVDDTFIQLGGDSLAAINLAAAARERGLSLSVAQVFQYPQLRELAASLEVQTTGNVTKASDQQYKLLQSTEPVEEILQRIETQHGIRREDVEEIMPCSSLQEGLMFLSIRQPSNCRRTSTSVGSSARGI
jgi:acyl carrier protein